MGAVALPPGRFSALEGAVERLAIDANLPVPSLWLMEGDEPNACAAGESPYVAGIGVSTATLSLLSPLEMLAVLAHEIAHIKLGHVADRTNRALLQRGIVMHRVGSAATTIGAALSWVHPIGGLAVAGIGGLAKSKGETQVSESLAINRTWEADADHYAARLGVGKHLASALLRISQVPCQYDYPDWSKPLMFTVRGEEWSDHPPIGWRIDRGLATGGTSAFPCPSCLHPVTGGWPCRCGASAPGTEPCECGRPLGYWDRFCSNCGEAHMNSACQHCGSRGGGRSAFCPTCRMPRP